MSGTVQLIVVLLGRGYVQHRRHHEKTESFGSGLQLVVEGSPAAARILGSRGTLY
jgi:hypothetical protein